MFVPNTLRGSFKIKPLAFTLFLIIALPHFSCVFHAVPENDFGIKIKNFGQISENYYRGGQPEAADIASLKKLGIRTVIDLQQDGDEQERDWVQDAGLTFFRIPLSTSKPATAEQTEYFLKLVDDPNNWPVFVHCAAGRHRTGGMTAIYRITHDSWTADQAYEEMKKYGYYSFPNHGPLKDYVIKYYRSHMEAMGESGRNPPKID
jgi:tyrosine-protein phosphatase SIW14